MAVLAKHSTFVKRWCASFFDLTTQTIFVSSAFVLCVFVFIEIVKLSLWDTRGVGFSVDGGQPSFSAMASVPERIPATDRWKQVCVRAAVIDKKALRFSSRTGLRPFLLSRCSLCHDVGPTSTPADTSLHQHTDFCE